MPRATNSPASHRRHKKILKAAKGFRGRRKDLVTTAKDAVLRANCFAYRDRRRRKRDFRRLWITRISAASEAKGLTYSRFMHGLREAGVEVDRKMLAELAIDDPATFSRLVSLARSE